MKTGLDVVMYLFILLVIIAAIRNSQGFARDVTAVGSQATGFSQTILSNAGSS